MPISGDVPQHLVVAARTGFLTAVTQSAPSYTSIATVINMDAKSMDLVDLGAAPMPVEAIGKTQVQDFVEKTMTVKPKNWEITVKLSYNAIKDDQTGSLETKVRAAGSNFSLAIANRAFKALNDGDATTNFGACYDGKAFYANDHVDKGASYQTAQDNLNGLALSLDNFETVRVAALNFKQDQGEFASLNYDQLVVSPALERIAGNICNNPFAMDTANRENNPYAGIVKPLVSQQFDSTAWILTASSAPIKPIIITMREMPNLQSVWFDPNGPDGGMYYFKFYSRYNHYYGDWRTAIMGNS